MTRANEDMATLEIRKEACGVDRTLCDPVVKPTEHEFPASSGRSGFGLQGSFLETTGVLPSGFHRTRVSGELGNTP